MLSVKGLRAGYRGVEILHGVDLIVPPGSAVALFGANGAGKSTLLKAVTGLLRESSGEVRLGGQVLNGMSTYRRARMGLCLVPEGRAIFQHLSVRDNLAMHVRGQDTGAAVERTIAAFPVLERHLRQRAGTLSGGEQQMLALARAFVTSPRVVLADELSIGLSPVVVDEIFAAVKRLCERGVSLLMVEQYVDRALQVVDYVYVLHKGRIVYVGEPATCQADDLFARYLGAEVSSNLVAGGNRS
jgi:branched-chain amino acid transport system ATP-binding protein